MLSADKFLIKERVKILASHATYDIFDGDTQKQIGTAEEKIGPITKLLRWFVAKSWMPTSIEVREKPDESLVFSIRRGWYIFRSRVEIYDADGKFMGYFKSKLISMSGGFHVYDQNDKHFAEVKGNFVGYKYRVLTPDHKVELGKVNKDFSFKSIVKDLFTSADTYVVDINDDLKENPVSKILILAAALATDMIFKSESKGTIDADLGDD